MGWNWINDSRRDLLNGKDDMRPWVFPLAGRLWIYLSKDYQSKVGFDWNIWRFSCSAELRFGEHEDDLGFHIAFPPVSFWFSLNAKWAYKIVKMLDATSGKSIGFSIHSWAIWWNVWHGDFEGWSSNDPKWKHGSFHPIELLLGREVCTTRDIEARDVMVPMPEKNYPAKAKLVEYRWKRPRWFEKRMLRVQIDIPGGIPHSGKGTEAWNCGDDATFGLTTCARTIPEGVGNLVGSVLGDRVKYGGWKEWKFPRLKQPASK